MLAAAADRPAPVAAKRQHSIGIISSSRRRRYTAATPISAGAALLIRLHFAPCWHRRRAIRHRFAGRRQMPATEYFTRLSGVDAHFGRAIVKIGAVSLRWLFRDMAGMAGKLLAAPASPCRRLRPPRARHQ